MQVERLRGASRAPAALAAIAAAVILGACSKGEPQSTKARPNAPLETRSSAAPAPSRDDAVDEALKERLARQEAAVRLFEKNVLQPPPPKSAEAPKAPEPPPRAVVAPTPEPAPARAPEPAPRSEPPKVAVATPAAPPPTAAPTPAPTPAPVESVKPPPAPAKAAPKTDLAAARPAAPVDTTPRLLSRVEPDFPGEAYRAGIDQGIVRARMTLDNAGNVTKVDIVEAQPRRVFDRAVVRALSQWRFNEGASGRTVESEIAFKR